MNQKRKIEEPVTKQYEPSDYLQDSETASGLAVTHEQVSDTYMEGTIDRAIEEQHEENRKNTDK